MLSCVFTLVYDSCIIFLYHRQCTLHNKNLLNTMSFQSNLTTFIALYLFASPVITNFYRERRWVMNLVRHCQPRYLFHFYSAVLDKVKTVLNVVFNWFAD